MNKEEKRKPTIEKKRYTVFHMNQYKKTIFCFAPLATLLLLSLFAFTSTASAHRADEHATTAHGCYSNLERLHDRYVFAGDAFTVDLSDYSSDFEHFCNGYTFSVTPVGGGNLNGETISVVHETPSSPVISVSTTAPEGVWAGSVDAVSVKIKVIAPDLSVRHKSFVVFSRNPAYTGVRTRNRNNIPKCEQTTTKPLKDHTLLVGETTTIDLTEHFSQHFTHDECKTETVFHKSVASEHFTAVLDGTTLSLTGVSKGAGEAIVFVEEDGLRYYRFPFSVTVQTPPTPEPIISDPLLPSVETTTDTLSVEAPTSEEEVKTVSTEEEGETPTIDLKASSDTGVSDTDDITNDDTPTFTVAGFPDDALVTITARSLRTPHQTVTSTHVGNGDVTLPTLLADDYRWSVIASDGTIATPPITLKLITTKPRINPNWRDIGGTTDTTPDLYFHADRAGMLVANSACGITAQKVGHDYRHGKWHAIALTELAPATYATCTIQMIDLAGNIGIAALIPTFVIYTTEEGETPTIDLKASSDTGVSDTDDITNDDTPTFTVAGFPDDALVTITARSLRTPHQTVTSTHVGNGDVTLPTLLADDYRWSVIASDGTIATPPITLKLITTKPRINPNWRDIGGTTDTTPDLYFHADRAGMLVANSACGITAQKVGHDYRHGKWHAIALTELAPATYATCTIQMIDLAGNIGIAALIPTFVIYTTEEGETPTIDLKASSDTGVSDTDDITNDDTPTFTVAGFPDDALVTITARSLRTPHQTVTSTHVGNGDVTLPTLLADDYRWSVIASDGTIATPPITLKLITTKPRINPNWRDIGGTTDTTPDLYFHADRAGMLVANSACGITAQKVGHDYRHGKWHAIALTELAPATYATCTIQMIDLAGNIGIAALIPTFVIYTTEEGETPTIDLKASSDTGVSDTDDITNDDTPTFTVAGFPDDALVTITARSLRTPHQTVTSTHVGNGDVTLPTLLADDYRWSVIASDGTIATPPITLKLITTKPRINPNWRDIGGTTDTTPDLYFHADRAGMLVANSACGITAQKVGHDYRHGKWHAIALTELAPATYATCTIQMIDLAGNIGIAALIPTFVIYTTEEGETPITPEPVISDPISPTVETITTDTLSADTLASECNTKTQKVKTQRILVGYTEKINLSDHFSSDLCSLTFSVKTTDKVDAEVKGGDKLLLTANKESRSKVTVVAHGTNSDMTQTFRVKAYNLPAVDTLTDKQRFIVRKITEHNSKNNYLLVTFWRRAFFDLVGKKEVKIKRAKTEKGTKEYKSLSTLLWHLKQ